MGFINWVKDTLTTTQEAPAAYKAPDHRPDHDTLLYTYFEKYINALNPEGMYDVREILRSGMIITHKECVTLREAKDYTRMVWIDSVPPNFMIEVSTTPF